MISNHHNSKQKTVKEQPMTNNNRSYHSTKHHLYFYNDPEHQYNVEISYFERPKKQTPNSCIQRNYSIQHKIKPKHVISDNFSLSTNSSYDSSFQISTDDDENKFSNKKKIIYKNQNTSIALNTKNIKSQRSNHATPDSAYATLTNSSNNTINRNSKYNRNIASRLSHEHLITSDTSINDVSSNFSLEKPSSDDFLIHRPKNHYQHQKQPEVKQQHQYKRDEPDYQFRESSLIVQKCESEIIFDDSKYYEQISRCKTPTPRARPDDSYKVSNELMQNSLLNSTLNTCDFDNMDTSELGDYIDKLRIQFRLNSNLYTDYKNMSFLKEEIKAPVAPRQSPIINKHHPDSTGSISNQSNSTLKSLNQPINRQTNKNNVISNHTFETGKFFHFKYFFQNIYLKNKILGTSSNITTVTKDENFNYNKFNNKQSNQMYNECSEDETVFENDEEEEEDHEDDDDDDDVDRTEEETEIDRHVSRSNNNVEEKNVDDDFNDNTFINFTQSYELIDTMMDIKSDNFEQPSNNQFMQESEIIEEDDIQTKNNNNNNNIVYSKPPTPIKTPLLIKQYNDQRLYDKFSRKQNFEHPPKK